MLIPHNNLGINERYSAFDHLVEALFLDGESLMLIVAPDPLTLYCDASRTLADRFTVVAGAVASVQNWKNFDREWREVLAENDLRYFRMSEFAHSVGQFKKGWKRNEQRRQEFFFRLARIVVRHVRCWVGAGVSREVYEAADRVYQLHEYNQPFTACGLTCINLAQQWQHISHLDYLPMEYIFEEGDEPAGQLLERCKEWYGQYPIFRKKIDDAASVEQPVTPLQVGDIAAYEIGKVCSMFDPEVEALYQHFRTSFGLLGATPHKWGLLTELGLRAEMNLRRVPRR
jgi:hypothetical protein